MNALALIQAAAEPHEPKDSLLVLARKFRGTLQDAVAHPRIMHGHCVVITAWSSLRTHPVLAARIAC